MTIKTHNGAQRFALSLPPHTPPCATVVHGGSVVHGRARPDPTPGVAGAGDARPLTVAEKTSAAGVRANVRQSLQKHAPGFLAFADAARERLDAKLVAIDTPELQAGNPAQLEPGVVPAEPMQPRRRRR